eukprot:CAMPEP_0204536978 /NCGR_PEP_ID=MMETSP0661-20131031/14871_1 /ASSEMBLY_ACC=CAM_ASM_000606 /TAXON_ID=109239 /ORGANISM="Alexandrium margalefi, Strain AMGDE01CS-322" /LENGTH=79 /DNA_ID=CAMNT_0051543517 /DNA_START=31 /DNA_END=266 /DNA_ORIENTATION=+
MGFSVMSKRLRASCESEAEDACSTPPATCEGFLDRSVVGVKSVAAAGSLAGPEATTFLGGGGGALAPAGSSATLGGAGA